MPLRPRIDLKIFLLVLFTCMMGHQSPVRAAPTKPMGAIPDPDGTVFRLWMPDARSVEVTINGRRPIPMELESGHTTAPDMIWTARIDGAKPGDKYQYLIDSGAGPTPYVDPYARQLTGYDNDASSVIVDTTSLDDRFEMAPANKLVIYEMHIGTFNADSKGKYTFAGAAQKLDYLKTLGVNAVELMPINLNRPSHYHQPFDYNWGYDGIHPFAIKPSYGTPADFKAFVRACHRHGIAVILDLVYNHLANGNLLERYGGISSVTSPLGIYFCGTNLGPTLWGPRPNFESAQVRSYFVDNALMWLTEYGVDGERWDSVDNIRAYYPIGGGPPSPWPGGEEFLREFNDAKPPHKLAIAEDTWLFPQTTQSTSAGGLGFDSQWNNSFSDSLRQVVSASSDAQRNLANVVRALALKYGDSAFHRVIYTEDHDMVGHPPNQIRFPSSADPADPASMKAKQLSTLAATIVLTSPGIPMLFQGQEMLDPRPFDFGSATFMDWTLTQRNPGIVALYRKLIELRKNIAGTTAGLTGNYLQVYHIDDATKTLAYRRYDASRPSDDVVVVANFSGKTWPALAVGFPSTGRWKVRLDTASLAFDPEFSSPGLHAVVAKIGALEGLPAHGTVSIGHYSALILSH